MADPGSPHFVVELTPASEHEKQVATEFYKRVVHLVYDDGCKWEDALVRTAEDYGVFRAG